MTSAFSSQNSARFCPASFCTPRPNLPVTPGYLLTSYFGIPVLYDEKKKPFNFSFFSITGWGIDLESCLIEWFALEMNRGHSVIFEIAPMYCISNCFVGYEGYSISSKGFLPTEVDIMVI